ncbi:MAG: hypothetical protein GTN89_14110, partial [Acidobacteria bacterium]|nr:hypothetical protein [Acidobacteriota bacterium]NIQ31470.1 hypothetical protein [Acidobacteriota bacterium]
MRDAGGDGRTNVHGARDRDFNKAVAGVVVVTGPLNGREPNPVDPGSIDEMEAIAGHARLKYSRARDDLAHVHPAYPPPAFNTEAYDEIDENGFR